MFPVSRIFASCHGWPARLALCFTSYIQLRNLIYFLLWPLPHPVNKEPYSEYASMPYAPCSMPHTLVPLPSIVMLSPVLQWCPNLYPIGPPSIYSDALSCSTVMPLPSAVVPLHPTVMALPSAVVPLPSAVVPLPSVVIPPPICSGGHHGCISLQTVFEPK